MSPDQCQWCGVEMSPRFGFGCCDECSERLACEFAESDEADVAEGGDRVSDELREPGEDPMLDALANSVYELRDWSPLDSMEDAYNVAEAHRAAVLPLVVSRSEYERVASERDDLRRRFREDWMPVNTQTGWFWCHGSENPEPMSPTEVAWFTAHQEANGE